MLSHPDLYRSGGFFEIFVTHNKGIAFSIPLYGTTFYLVLFCAITLGIYYSRDHLEFTKYRTAVVIGLIIGGGIGNLIDRLRYNAVIDFIKLGPWPLFNIADSAITAAVVILFLWRHTILKNVKS
jgi:signal peptidase II